MEATLIAQGPVDCGVMPSDAKTLRVEFFVQAGDDPFICGVNGHATIDALVEIALDVDRDETFDKGDGSYLFEVTRDPGQYGYEGRCEIAPHWELTLLAFKPLDGPGHNAGGNAT